jgi:soluble lytic murein transglycosylase
MMVSLARAVGTAGLVAVCLVAGSAGPTADAARPISGAATSTLADPLAESVLWLAPPTDPVGGSNLSLGVRLLAGRDAAGALTFFARDLGHPVLGPYARYYTGRAELALGRHEAAAQSARRVIETSPGGAVGEAALWLLAEALEADDDWREAVPVWQTLAGINSPRLAESLLRLAVAAGKVGDQDLARGTYVTIYYEHPASAEAGSAATALVRWPNPVGGADLPRLEINRAEKLFAARRWSDARRAFDVVRTHGGPDARAAAELRIAQCDFHLNHFSTARDALRKILDRPGGANIEAEYYWLGTLRGLKRGSEYVTAVDRFVAANPGHPRAEAALNELATHYILGDDDRAAASVFARQYAMFPTGAFADRAAWKAGWWAYRTGNYRETIRIFETAAAAMRRADYRPSWLYWAAKAHLAVGEREAAALGFRQTISFYRNSYYGREAARELSRLPAGRTLQTAGAMGPSGALTIAAGTPPANALLIQTLLEAELWDDAVAELRHAGRAGTSPFIEASIAYALNRKGELRPGITAMRRAYPQFMAEGGEALPGRILRVIFPVAYQPLLERYAGERRLDRFLLTALVAQESTFQADVRSAANAWGLMQLLPATGRRVGAQIGVRGVTTARLTDPELNVRLGTAYLSALLKQFGDNAKALAAYNAGEHRVVRWEAERPGIDRDEFVDDIPFPETQNYVKRIIGTAEDYRNLYGGAGAAVVRQSAR